jgi:hypothetical protein
VQWLEQNKHMVAKDKHRAEELGRFRSEAREILKLNKQ